jgi:hypothetical protein
MKPHLFPLKIAAAVLIIIAVRPLLADETNDSPPFNYLTNNLPIPSNAPRSLTFMGPPPALFEEPLPNSPATSTNFLAAGYSGSIFVPDTMGAVGTNRLMVMLNTTVRIQDRGGTVLTNTGLTAWWSEVGITLSAFDPRVAYDANRDRWIACAVADRERTNASLLIGVSATSDPAGAWYRYKYVVAPGRWADFPQLGFNNDKIATTFTYFGAYSNGTVLVIFDKETLYSGTAPALGSTYSWKELGTNLGYGLTPAFVCDTNQSSLYLVQSHNSGAGRLALYEIKGTVAAPVMTTNGYPTNASGGWAASGLGSSADAYGNFAPQADTSQLIDNNDDRMLSVVYRNGLLWCAHTIFLPASNPTYSAVQWWKLNPTNGNVIERGSIGSQTLYCAFPSIAVNRFNDALIGYSTFSSNQYASAAYSLKACTNRSGTFQNPAVLKAGIAPFWLQPIGGGRCRWGDYSATMVDPVNDADFWTIQEYAAERHVYPTNSALWGTWWGKIELPLQPNDHFTNSHAISGAQGSTNGSNVRSSREAGEPSHAGNANTPSVWYSWTAPADGNVSFTVNNNRAFDQALAIYTGSSVGGLTTVTNDHATAPVRVTFNATSNAVYRIAFAGLNGACGGFTLAWTQPTAPMFTLQPERRDVFMGSNVTFTAMAIGVPNPAYQWRFNGSNIGGATASFFTTNNVSTNTTGDFTVVATNSSGSATSVVAHLEVYSTQRALLSGFGYLSNGFRSVVSGITGASYVVQASTNLINWSAIETNQTTFTNLDVAATNSPRRFYRVLFVP